MARRGRVPKREMRDAVRMHVLRALEELGERGDLIAGFGVNRVGDLQKDGHVALDDQRSGNRRSIGMARQYGLTRKRVIYKKPRYPARLRRIERDLAGLRTP